MSLHDYLKGDASNPKSPGGDESFAGLNAGPFIGLVKNNTDPSFMGKLGVFIPALAKTENPGQNQLITCEYLAPFYGAKGQRYSRPGGQSYESSQHSYGMWAVPPDLESKVLVIFAEGKMEKAFWIGCIQDPYTNHMVPGIASSENTYDGTKSFDNMNPAQRANATGTVDKEKTYGTTFVPSGELNRSSPGALNNLNYDSIPKPVHPFADVLKQQGLGVDTIRGTTTSSARRESPSQVFGISTPGPKDNRSIKQPVGTLDSQKTDFVSRETGHTFVMDDGDSNGSNKLTRLRTGAGHQILMHDTAGCIYVANASGDSWIELSASGKMYVYAADGINMRSQGNFDLHADGDINFHSNNSIKFTADGELVNNAKFILNAGNNGIFSSSTEGPVATFAKQTISSFTPGQQLHGAGGPIHLAGKQVHMNSVGASSSWGPGWLNEKSAGIVRNTKTDMNDVLLTVEDGLLKPNTKNTNTTISHLVTHEPFTRAPSYPIETVSSWENEDEWKKLSETPGTLEFMAQQNRESNIEAVRIGQYKVDLKKYLDIKTGKNVSTLGSLMNSGMVTGDNKIAKATEFAKTFNKTYNKFHNVKMSFQNPSIESVTQLLQTNVVGNHITAVSSALKDPKGFIVSNINTIASFSKNIFGGFRGSAPGSLMGSGMVKGGATPGIFQIAKTSIGKAFSKFFG